MIFAQRVFLVAGIFGLLLLPPMYFLEEHVGQAFPPVITHAEFFYGFVGATLPWQLVYLWIALNPRRYRPIMPLAILAKGSFVIAVLVLVLLGRTPVFAAMTVSGDLLFVTLFDRAYWLTADADSLN